MGTGSFASMDEADHVHTLKDAFYVNQESIDWAKKALRRQQALEKAIKDLSKATDIGSGTKSLIQGMTVHVESLKNFFRTHLTPEVYSETPSQEPVFAHKTLNTTELLEKILDLPDTPDLLRAQRVNRKFRDVVNSSTLLLRQMSLFLSKNDYLQLLRNVSPFLTLVSKTHVLIGCSLRA